MRQYEKQGGKWSGTPFPPGKVNTLDYSFSKNNKKVLTLLLHCKSMKKNLLLLSYVLKQREITQILRIMKCTVLLLFLLILQAHAGSVSSQNARVSITKNNLPLKEFMTEIEKQTDYLFIYSDTEVNVSRKVNVTKGTHRVGDLLGEVLPKNNISYSFSDNYISLHSRKEAPINVVAPQQDKNLIKVSGTVVDPVDVPIIGANVKLKGAQGLGTITDVDGNFKLEVPANGVLVISYIGYTQQEVPVRGKSSLKIQLAEDSEVLDEVVVTALGIKREEKALGYAVQKVGGSKLSTVKPVNIATSLTGKIAGLNVTNSTEFNAAPSLKLRGESPLLVVDGVPYSNISLNDIAADDIESIDVLKGATASALYGARGGSGAIMVTTKKGGAEGLNVSVNSSTMFNAGYLVLPEVQHGYSTGQGGKYTAADFVWGDKLDIGRTAVQYDPITHEWREMPLVSKGKDNFKNFLETGFVTNNNVSISQKGKYGSFRSSLSHVYNKGQYPNQKLNKITYSVGGDMKFGKLSFEGGAIYNKRFYPNGEGAGYGGGGYIYNLLVWTGTDYDVRDYKDYWVKKDEQQNWMNDDWYDNPYFLANEVTSSNDYDKVNAYLSGKYDIFPWLNFSIRGGADAYANRTEKKNAMSARGGWHKNGYFYTDKSTGFSFNGDFLLAADHKFGDFAIDGFVGGTIYYYFDDNITSNTRNGLSIPGYYSLKASVDPISASSTYKQKQVNSLYGKFSASWKSTLFVDVTARNDWSSTLPSETRSYFYPSVSGSLILSQLIDMPSWLKFWKLRGSWTVTKSDLSIYETNQAYSVSTNVWNGMNTAVYPEMLRSSTLEPTAARSYEIGTAFNVWDNRLRFDIAYYNKLKYNLTREATISGSSGFKKTLVNYDEEQVRRGVELSVTASLIQTKDWNWELNLNWARDRYFYAKVDPLYSTQKPWVAGGERWDWYGIYDWERDPQGNIIHENGYPVQSKYQSVMGNEYPDFIWGANTSLRYKDWTLGISLDGRVGGMAYSRTEQTMWNTGVHPDSDNQWRYDEVVDGKKNYVGQGVKVVSGKVDYDTSGRITNDTRVFASNDKQVSYESYVKTYNPWSGDKVYQNVHDCTFLKLRELSLLYTMPKPICEKLHMKGITLGLIGQNLLIWTKEFKFADPDVDEDNLNSPSMRYLGFNVKLDF